jgi:hypothetical protein
MARPLTGALLCHFTPGRSFMVSVRRSGEPLPGLRQVRHDLAELRWADDARLLVDQVAVYQLVDAVERRQARVYVEVGRFVLLEPAQGAAALRLFRRVDGLGDEPALVGRALESPLPLLELLPPQAARNAAAAAAPPVTTIVRRRLTRLRSVEDQ